MRGTLVSLHALFQHFSWPPNSFKNQKPWRKHVEADDTEHLAAISGIKVLPSLGCLKAKNLLLFGWIQAELNRCAMLCHRPVLSEDLDPPSMTMAGTLVQQDWRATGMPQRTPTWSKIYFLTHFSWIYYCILMSVLPQNIFDRKKLPRNPSTLSPSLMARPDLSNLRANRLMDLHRRSVSKYKITRGWWIPSWYVLVHAGTC